MDNFFGPGMCCLFISGPLYSDIVLCYKKIEGLGFNGEEIKMEENEIREESRKIRFLRFLVDFSILSIQQNDLSLEEAVRVVEDVKRVACNFFPGKEQTFELIYRPRFQRVIEERFRSPMTTQSPQGSEVIS